MHPLPLLRSRIAILVLKEADLKQPYQALVIRQGARLFQGIKLPRGQEAMVDSCT